MRTLILAFLVTCTVNACLADDRPDPLYKVSVMTLLAAQSADIASSWGKYERNPILGQGQFGKRQVALKGGMAAGGLALELLIIKRWPKSRRVFRWVNFAGAGVVGATAVHNWTIPRTPH
jgi:hypothetical protein